MKCPPPMANASPSPPSANTLRSGLPTLMPVAMGMDRGLLAAERSVGTRRSSCGNYRLEHAFHAKRLAAIHVEAREFHVLIVRFQQLCELPGVVDLRDDDDALV